MMLTTYDECRACSLLFSRQFWPFSHWNCKKNLLYCEVYRRILSSGDWRSSGATTGEPESEQKAVVRLGWNSICHQAILLFECLGKERFFMSITARPQTLLTRYLETLNGAPIHAA